MLKAATFAILFLATSTASFADQARCEQVLKQAEKEQVLFSPVESYKVVGEGRLYFHTAPHEDCRTKDVFVVPGDNLTASTEYKGWYSVLYINSKTGKDYDGWVEFKRLKFTGTMGPKNY